MPKPETVNARDEVVVLLDVLDRAWDRASWHGVNLRGSLRRVSAADAAWRPHRSRHNVWETAVHCAEAGSRAADAWREDLALLASTHDQLRDVVADMRPARLRQSLAGGSGRTTVFETVSGSAAHDPYHAGQIQLLKALRRSRRR